MKHASCIAGALIVHVNGCHPETIIEPPFMGHHSNLLSSGELDAELSESPRSSRSPINLSLLQEHSSDPSLPSQELLGPSLDEIRSSAEFCSVMHPIRLDSCSTSWKDLRNVKLSVN